jgi:hypothetical protein
MRKNIIMIAAMLTVMVAMTGIAAATVLSAEPQNIGITEGGSNTTNLKYDSSGQVTWRIIDATTSITSEVLVNDGNGTDYTSTGVYTSTANNPNLMIVQDQAGDNLNADYKLQSCPPGYNFGDSYCTENHITVYVSYIPEFPTVALPIAAVIGLVFLFQNKKKKEE